MAQEKESLFAEQRNLLEGKGKGGWGSQILTRGAQPSFFLERA
jgi:hypothetical protein